MPKSKNLLALIAIILGVMFLFNISQESSQGNVMNFSDFLGMVDGGKVTEVVIKGNQVAGVAENRYKFTTVIPNYYQNLVTDLYGKGVRFKVEPAESNSLFYAILSSWLPILLIIGVWVFFMKQMQGGNKMMGFGKSKPKELTSDKKKVTFADVAGIEEAKHEVDEIVEFLKDPNKFERLGGKIPTGVLLVGQPGTGKTLLAKAIAGEAGVSFFSISGSDFVEMFVGVGASRVRDLFSQAREQSPCIVFIDEIDAVGRHRGAGLGGGNDEREQTLNQLLVEMDGFGGNEGIIVIAATNRPDVLDPALTRPGRFDRQVMVPPPDLKGRVKILGVHVKNIQMAPEVDLKTVARATPGFTGADLANLTNEAALMAARKNKSQVELIDFEDARDKIMMGSERRSMSVPKKEKKTTAYHEAGHAIIAAMLKEVDPVHKVTIIPRGQALGLTMLLPTDDNHSQRQSQLEGMLAMMMGGRAAEEIIFNHFTTGASNDLERSTQLAHQMVCNWGMSEEIGPVYLADGSGEVFLGRDMMKRKKISQLSAIKIDREVRRIVDSAYEKAVRLLNENLKSLHEISLTLIEEETIDGSYVVDVLKNNGALTD